MYGGERLARRAAIVAPEVGRASGVDERELNSTLLSFFLHSNRPLAKIRPGVRAKKEQAPNAEPAACGRH
jgi:hypothetical protein